MVSKTIKVCVRTRPTATFAANQIVIEPETKTVTLQKQSPEEAMLNNAPSSFKFQFHHVLHNASQETVYETLSRDVVQDAVDGINGTIMTYGQTGSGKTFTMLGDQNNYLHRGVAPRAIAHVFAEVGLRVETAFRITCTYMEIYNERIFDLLKSASSSEEPRGVGGEARADYAIVEDKGGRGVLVRGLREVECATEADALNLLFTGQLARTTAPHKLNRNSNRSHSIFTLVIQQQARSGVSERIVTSKLNLVDLAGSERLKKTMDGTDGTDAPLDGTLKKESMYINQSLTYLEQCVVALARRTTQHVAYRQTKLTSVLKDSLGGNCSTLLFACIWGEARHLEETTSTLRLAARMMRVHNSAVAVETTDPIRHARRQDAVIRELRQELLMHNALADRGAVKYEPYTTEERAELARRVKRYAEADPGKGGDILQFESVREMREMCDQFKLLLKTAEERNQQVLQMMMHSADGDGGNLTPAAHFADGLDAATTKKGHGAPKTGAPNHNAGTTKNNDTTPAGTTNNNSSSNNNNNNNNNNQASSDMASSSAYVGELQPGSGFALGRAPDLARPLSTELSTTMNTNMMASPMTSPTGNHQRTNNEVFSPTRGRATKTGSPVASAMTTLSAGGEMTYGGATGGMMMFGATGGDESMFLFGAEEDSKKARLFEQYKRSPAGAGRTDAVAVAKAARLAARASAREAAKRANGHKASIDHATGLLAAKRREARTSDARDDDVVDEEEFALMKQERDLKRAFREAHGAYLKHKADHDRARADLDRAKATLLAHFDKWAATGAAHGGPQGIMAGGHSGDGGDGGDDDDDFYSFAGGGGGAPEDDKLDDQEQFEKLVTDRIVSHDPDALAFFQAQKTRRATQTQNRTQLRQLHRNKRA